METKHDIRKALLVADGGSTKTDWCLAVPHREPQLFRTHGLNPALLELPAIREILQTELLPRLTPHLQDPFIPFQFLLLMIGLLILSMVGVIDDLIRIDYRRKFVAQIVASLFLPLSGLWINDLYGLLGITTLSPWIGMPLTVFVAVFIINAGNLIDGIDGLCSGLVGMGALVFGFLFIYNGAWLHAVFAFITAGVLCPFFYYNVFGKSKGRQRIFMGDTGSLTLGLSMAFLAISYAMNNPLIKPFSEGAIVSFALLQTRRSSG